jgi:DivIVA domain-containing protein
LALDRQSIEKKDFPVGRRGYEPEAVDAHLAAIAREFEVVRRGSERRSGESLATTASEHVKAIVEAAEATAKEIERQANDEASQIRVDASVEAEKVRDDAATRSFEHVSRVHEATAHMLQRIDAMESELGALFESLRTGANRLHADLSLLEGNVGDLGSSFGREPAARAEPAGPAQWSKPATQVDEPAPEEPAVASANGETPAALEGEPESAPAPLAAAESGDVEGARLVALNMALNGQPREETDRYLAEKFELADRSALLDEVYEAVQG